MDREYLDHHFPLAIGRVMGNLWSLEWMLRNVLYLLEHPLHTQMPRPRLLFAANVGDRFPENALTSYFTLRQLIAAYNETAPIRLDASLVTLRDALAHGRVLFADEAWVNLELVKFTKPVNDEVVLEVRCELTRQRLVGRIARVGAALESVMARYRDVGGLSLGYMNRRRLNAPTSTLSSENHSPFPRLAANRRCQ